MKVPSCFLIQLAFVFIGSTSIAAVPAEDSGSPIEVIMNEDLIRALRDPFEVPSVKEAAVRKESDLELYQLRDFKLNGVITGPKKVRAMVTTPKGSTFFVKVGDTIGAREGKVVSINADAIRVVEFYVDERGRRIPDTYDMKINGELELIDRKDRD